MDNNDVKIIKLSNRRRFAFSSKYKPAKIKEYLIESRILYNTIATLPVMPSQASELEEELIRRSIFGTAAIKGNPLTEERVS